MQWHCQEFDNILLFMFHTLNKTKQLSKLYSFVFDYDLPFQVEYMLATTNVLGLGGKYLNDQSSKWM